MAAIDKIYVDSYEKYVEFKEWCEKQPPFTDKYGVKEPMTRYLITGWEKENWVEHPIASFPFYIDAYIIRNCPFNYIQKELMIRYGHHDQEWIDDAYKSVMKRGGEKAGFGEIYYWLSKDDFKVVDGVVTMPNEKESTYSLIKRGLLLTSPFTDIKYEVGKHFKCIKHPPHFYNFPLNMKNWWVDIILPDGMGFMYYHTEHNSWDFDDEYVIADWSSSTAFIGTIKALKRHMVKWKLPVGTIVRATGRYISDTYEFVIKK
jgi:hypothetical protein